MSGKYLFGFVLPFLFTACNDGQEKDSLPESKGVPCELLVVVPSDLQQTAVTDTLLTITDCDAPGLGSSERIFRTMVIGDRGYKGMYRLMHTQLRVEVDSKVRKPSLGVAHDVMARPQLQLLVKAASDKALARYLSENRERIQRLILDFQLDRQAEQLRKKYSKKVNDELHRLGYEVCMPVDMASAKRGKHFLWGSSNRGGDKDINFVFYSLPWQGEEIGDTERFVAVRDSVLRANIPGAQEGQWMETMKTDEGEPVIWPMLREGGQLMEVRGLWSMHGGFMGGPFVSHLRVDTVARRVIVAEGFVFSPNSAKRDLLRSVEAGLRTLRCVP